MGPTLLPASWSLHFHSSRLIADHFCHSCHSYWSWDFFFTLTLTWTLTVTFLSFDLNSLLTSFPPNSLQLSPLRKPQKMPRSSKTKRVLPSVRSMDDNVSTTSAITASTVPPHLRGVSSVSSPPVGTSPVIPPHLRSASTQSAAPVKTTSPPSASISRAQMTAKPTNPVAPSRSAFPCPYAGCHMAFASEALLIKHKVSLEAGHDYCKVCNQDFEDDDAYHLHKLNSDKHITCKICSEDFKSEAGCKRHESQASGMMICQG